MPTIGSRAANAKLAINQGADFSFEIEMRDAARALVNLAGSTFQGQIRKTKDAASPIVSFSMGISGSKVTFSLTNIQTSSIPAGAKPSDPASQYVYDIEWTKPGGSKERILEGVVEVSAEVTR